MQALDGGQREQAGGGGGLPARVQACAHGAPPDAGECGEREDCEHREAGRRAQAEERRHDGCERAVDRRQHAEGEDDAGRSDAGQHPPDAARRVAAARDECGAGQDDRDDAGEHRARGLSPVQNGSLQSA